MKRVTPACLIYDESNLIFYQTSKQIYRKLVEDKTMCTNYSSAYLQNQVTSVDENYIFNIKVKLEKENKIKEYNFKLLHGILPCNRNLKVWRIKESDACDLCGIPQNIKHLLYDCVYIKPVWEKVTDIFNVDMSFSVILGEDSKCPYNNVISVVGFLIYKCWLLASLEGKDRNHSSILLDIKSELLTRIKIYQNCKRIKHSNVILLERLYQSW